MLVLGDVLRPLEHHVLEQVGEAGAPGRLVAPADLVPDVDGDLRHAAVLVQDHLEAVAERVLLERDLRQIGRGGRGAGAVTAAGGATSDSIAISAGSMAGDDDLPRGPSIRARI